MSVDLEVDPRTATVFAFAAVRDGRPAIVAKKADIESGLDRLERELVDAAHIVGHNIIRHDLPHLAALRPALAHVFNAPIDTLWPRWERPVFAKGRRRASRIDQPLGPDVFHACLSIRF